MELEKLSSILSSLQRLKYKIDDKSFQINIKALYNILQYGNYSPEDDEARKVLQELFKVLKWFIQSGNIFPGSSLLSSSCLVHLLSHISSFPAVSFEHLLNYSGCNSLDVEVEKLNLDIFNCKVETETSGRVTKSELNHSENLVEGLELPSDYILCKTNLILIQGILNVKPRWLFDSYILVSQKKDDPSTKESGNSKNFTENLCFRLWEYIKPHCTASVTSCQPIQVLLLWLQYIHTLLKDEMIPTSVSSAVDEISSTSDPLMLSAETMAPFSKKCHITKHTAGDKPTAQFNVDQCLLCSDPYLKPIFSLYEDCMGEVIQAINLNLENQSKGIGSVLLQCYKETFSLHDIFVPSHSTCSVRKILQSVATQGNQNCRTFYLLVQMGLDILPPQEVIRSHACIPNHLCEGLRTNQFSILAANVLLVLARELVGGEWNALFRSVHLFCTDSKDQLLWQNYKVLVLTAIITLHPELIWELVDLSTNLLHEWDAKVSILKICRTKGLADILNWGQDDLIFFEMPQDNHALNLGSEPSVLEILERPEITSGSHNHPKRIILKGFVHSHENIRAEVFALLCVTQKTSSPLSDIEVVLLKQFLRHNMNVDSHCFRQSLIKSFKSLIIRIRDSCTHELKINNLTGVEDISLISPVLGLSCKFLIWIIFMIGNNLNLLNNYSRHSTALNLYWVILSAFHCDSKRVSAKEKHPKVRLRPLRYFISKLSERSGSTVVNSNLTSPLMLETLLICCTHQMNDIREMAANIVLFIHSQIEESNPMLEDSKLCKEMIKSPEFHCTSYQDWFKIALKFIDSPKEHREESGATLVKVLIEICPADNFVFLGKDFVPELVPTTSTPEERLLNVLVAKIENQFKGLRGNILLSSYQSPVSGTILTLTTCLVDCRRVKSGLRSDFSLNILSLLSHLYQRIVRFVLESLAVCAPNGAEKPPSFAEMGESIAVLVSKCSQKNDFASVERNEEQRKHSDSCPQSAQKPAEVPTGGTVTNGESSAAEHRVVLSCFWHLLKMCCSSASRLAQSFSSILDDDIFDRFLNDVIVFVLLGTRHKGAMEAAQEALSLVTQCAFQTPDLKTRRIHLLEERLYGVLGSLESCQDELHISTTRRAAGLSMLFSAVCENVPQSHSRITSLVIHRLIIVARKEMQAENLGNVDIPPSLSMHILQSLVLNSKLTTSTTPHLAPIAVTCLQNFESGIWSVRNAALQLFGAVVPRLLGQKKVKEDMASVNSISASKFFHQNPTLSSVILKHLEDCSRDVTCPDYDLKRDTGELVLIVKSPGNLVVGNIKLYSSEASVQLLKGTTASLIPLLTLLARLNPGCEFQRRKEVISTIEAIITYLLKFLSCPNITVRRLASMAIAALSNEQERLAVLHWCLQNISPSNNNLAHGCLSLVSHWTSLVPDIINEDSVFKTKLVSSLQASKNSALCLVNQTLIIEILHNLGVKRIYDCNEMSIAFTPGSSLYTRRTVKYQLERGTMCVLEGLKSEDQDVWEEVTEFVANNMGGIISTSNVSQLQDHVWRYLIDTSNLSKICLKTNKLLGLLKTFLKFSPLNVDLAAVSIPVLNTLLLGENQRTLIGHVIVIVGYLVISHHLSVLRSVEFESLVSRWAHLTVRLSAPYVNEEIKHHVCEALRLSLPYVINQKGLLKEDVMFHLIKSAFNLLQDEDKGTRVQCSFTFISDDPLSKFMNPFLTLNELVNLVVMRALTTNPSYLRLLWELCFESSFKILEAYSKAGDFNLFESSTDNSYEEPQIVAGAVCSYLESYSADQISLSPQTKLEITILIHLLNSQASRIFELRVNPPFISSLEAKTSWENSLMATTFRNCSRFLTSLAAIFGIKKEEMGLFSDSSTFRDACSAVLENEFLVDQ